MAPICPISPEELVIADTSVIESNNNSAIQSNAELELDLANSAVKSVECDQSSASNENIIESIVSDFNVFKTGNFIKFEIIMQKYSFVS